MAITTSISPSVLGSHRGSTENRDDLRSAYDRVRSWTQRLAAPLTDEDCMLQSMPDASPVKWHLAHTTWFFETFVLKHYVPGYREYDAQYASLFNSYYNTVGAMHPRPDRGLLSRPTRNAVIGYRAHVDHAMDTLLEGATDADHEHGGSIQNLALLGLNHEQQHQELILTDIKHAFASNPGRPTYMAATPPSSVSIEQAWIEFADGVRRIGHKGAGFAFDNETPRHRQFVDAFELADRPVTNAEFEQFIEDGGYESPALWLSDGWEAVRQRDWSKPAYWHGPNDSTSTFTLCGMQPRDANAPVCHLSYYEADAYARWRGARLPTEAEWEVAAESGVGAAGSMLEDATFHPVLFEPEPGPSTGPVAHGMFGAVWEWTASPYTPFPGYRPPQGALGEYNGKFMVNQMVLRGGSCATAQDHIRSTYRNFFPPKARWQFSGLRLARDAENRRSPRAT